MNVESEFVQAVEAFLETTGMHATTFGVQAVKDPSFVVRLRGGMSPRAKTIDRVYAWMSNTEAKMQQAGESPAPLGRVE